MKRFYHIPLKIFLYSPRILKFNSLPTLLCVATTGFAAHSRSHGTDRISIIHHYNTLFCTDHSGGELTRTSDLGLMFSDLTLGRRGSPPQATPPPGWHDTGRTSSRCQPESVARAREPWADTLGTITLPTDVIRASRPQPAGCSADLDDVSIRGE